MIQEVTDFVSNLQQWKKEITLLRKIVLGCNLVETLKWKQPCYMYGSKNVLMLAQFKNHCSIAFFKGALLADTEKILEKPGENSQMARVIKFTDSKQITELENILTAYIFEAIEIERAGVSVNKIKAPEQPLPAEWLTVVKNDKALKLAFDKLTPGRQRAYLMFINATAQPATRMNRIEKYKPRILAGKGMHDCVCGLSKKMPACDGSHNMLKK